MLLLVFCEFSYFCLFRLYVDYVCSWVVEQVIEDVERVVQEVVIIGKIKYKGFVVNMFFGGGRVKIFDDVVDVVVEVGFYFVVVVGK